MPRLFGRPQAALLGAAILWSLSYPATVSALGSMRPDDLIALRFVLAAVLLVAVRPRLIRDLTKRDLVDGSVLGLLMMTAIELQTAGLQHVSESTSGFLISLFVVLTPLISWLALRHRIDSHVWVGVVLATAGVTVIAWHGLDLRPGVAVTLLSAIAWSVHLIANSARATPERALRLAAVQLMAGAVAASVLAAPGGIALPADTRTWVMVAYLVVFATTLCFLLQTWAQGAIPATQAAVLLTSEPVFIAAFAALAGRPPTAREIIGGAMLIMAMLIVETPHRHLAHRSASRRQEDGAPPPRPVLGGRRRAAKSNAGP